MLYAIDLDWEEYTHAVQLAHAHHWGQGCVDYFKEGWNNIPRHKAHELLTIFERDVEETGIYFPGVSPKSSLYRKMFRFMRQVLRE